MGYKPKRRACQNLDNIDGMLTTALEGGSNYWYTIEKFTPPKTIKRLTWKWGGNSNIIPQLPMAFEDVKKEIEKNNGKIFRHIDYPMNDGALLVSDKFGDMDSPKEIGLEELQKGCDMMPPKYYEKMNENLGNCDSVCADTFFQSAVFGDIIYG